MAGHRAAQAADGPRLAGAWCSGLRHGLALKGASGARARGRLGPACLGHAAGPACSTAQRAGPSRVAERREARSITEGDAAAAYCDFVYSSHSTCSGFGRGHGWGAGRGPGFEHSSHGTEPGGSCAYTGAGHFCRESTVFAAAAAAAATTSTRSGGGVRGGGGACTCNA